MALVPPNTARGGYPLGLAGATAATRYVGATASGAPASGTFAVGDFSIDQSGAIYVCTVAGSPGTWAAIGGSSLAAAKVSRTSADVTTASTTFVDMTGMSVAITTGARRCIVAASLTGAQSGAGNAVYVDLAIDGTRQGGTGGLVQSDPFFAGSAENYSFSFLTDVLSAAAHTIKLQWRVSSGTGTIFAGAAQPAVLGVVETLATA